MWHLELISLNKLVAFNAYKEFDSFEVAYNYFSSWRNMRYM